MSADVKPEAESAVEVVLVYSTFPDAAAAEAVAEALVGAGIVACANILPGLTSVFIWEGKLQREQEVAMILKTRAQLADAVVEEIGRRHPYDTPAIVVLPVAGGGAGFLDWIGRQTAGSDA